MSTALEETRVVVQEAINVFNPQHDIEQVRAFKKTASEIGVARHQQQLALKSLIKGKLFLSLFFSFSLLWFKKLFLTAIFISFPFLSILSFIFLSLSFFLHVSSLE